MGTDPQKATRAVISCKIASDGEFAYKTRFSHSPVVLQIFFAPAGRPRVAPIPARSAAYGDGSQRSDMPKILKKRDQGAVPIQG